MHPKTLKPKSFQVSTIPTYGLNKILQVSCHRCKKAIKIASKSVRSFSVRENWALYEFVMVKNKSDRLHNTGRYHKGQCNMTFFCAKRLSIQTNKRMATSASLCEGPIFYFYARVRVFFHIPFYLLFWQASCGEKRSKHIYPGRCEWAWIIIVDITLELNTLGGETMSPYLSICPVETFCSCVCGEC